jgi:ubiquinone/menaquinone biosynthesis C-methylase UbiE
MLDADAYREDALRRWEGAAAGWEKRRPAFQRAAQPVSMAMVDLLQPQPGQTILELAAGLGDTGLLVAELVQPAGRVILTDGAEAMVEAARRRAEELGIRNVETRTMNAEWIDLDAASLDGVIARWGYMLLADPEAALRDTRRVLRRGGRVVLAAWHDPDANPWLSAVTREMLARGHSEKPDPAEPGPFAFSEPGTIERLLDAAGFEDAEVHTVDFSFTFESTDAHFEHQLDMSTRLKDQLAELSPAEHTALRDGIDARLADYVRADGSVELPARTWVAAATA